MTFGQLWGAATGRPTKHPHPEHMQQARTMAAEGMVLLKNENDALPLKTKSVALFGPGAVDTVSCGTGSGFVFAPYKITVEQGLKNAGISLTSTAWLDRFRKASKKANKEDKTLSPLDRMWSGVSILIDDLAITEEELASARQADTAIYVLRRNAGEGGDRKAVKGDYYLTDVEEANLRLLGKSFAHTVVVLNSCVIDANFADIPGIDAVLLMGQAGCEGGNAVADVLTGKVCPSGHLTDTWAKKYEDNPASATFALNDGDPLQENYTEDIFVGYRYFDSFGMEPIYPFGYGLSYTTFSQDVVSFHADWQTVSVSVKVTNIGKVAGKEVVQVYATAPEGKLTKPYQELKGYAKTNLLNPGEAETVTVSFPTELLASYDMDKAAFVMEAGKYLIRVGSHSRKTEVAGIISLNAEANVRQLRNEAGLDRELELLTAPAREAIIANNTWMTMEEGNAAVCALSAADCVTVNGACKTRESDNLSEKRMENVVKKLDATLPDVKAGKVTMEEFVASLEDDVLLRLVTGTANETPYQTRNRMSIKVKPISGPDSSGGTTKLFTASLGIPNWLMTDGPAGLHLPGCGATCYPVGMVMAQTWDDSLARQMGVGIGKELKAYNYSVILGPGMNIHRDPLCGRAFEYYSEDPILSGKIAAATTRGVQQTPGAAVAIKHFCCNNQEESRTSSNSSVSERALREIYLRGYEICVKEADPRTIMTSYNKLNGIHTSSHYELLTEIVRGEWGFKGLFMTDWGSESIKPYDYHAGNDLIMGGYRTDFLQSALHGTAPELGDDGYIKVVESKVYGGFFTQKVEYWNRFSPDKDGSDTITISVAPGKEMNPKVAEFVESGIATVSENADGTKSVTYRGIDRGQYLNREDVQVCACRVLEQIMNSVSYDAVFGK